MRQWPFSNFIKAFVSKFHKLMNKNIHLREQTSFQMENECDPLLIISPIVGLRNCYMFGCALLLVCPIGRPILFCNHLDGGERERAVYFAYFVF